MGFDVSIDDRGISWREYPFREASVYPNRALTWADLRDVDAGALPPEVHTRHGETLFLPGDSKALLVERASKAGVPDVVREDVWSHLLDPFLDTEQSAKWIENSSRRLRACGISDRRRERIRAVYRPMMIAYNSLLWEWCHLGLYDFLRAVLLAQGLAHTAVPYRRLYGWAMAIAERGRRMERPREPATDTAALLYGELSSWPVKERMAKILEQAGLQVLVGPYAIRIESCSHFTFEEYGSDLGTPRIAADADSVEQLKEDGARVSDALARAGVRHRFELYDGKRFLRGYFHHDWPAPPETATFLSDPSCDTAQVRRPTDPPAAEEQVYEGIYVAHWEVSRFAVLGERVFGVLWRRVHKWQPIFPENFQLPDDPDGMHFGRGPARFYRMSVRGTLGPRGHHGHMGICEHQIVVSEVLSCQRTSTPGRTW